jgi:predicted membrane protein
MGGILFGIILILIGLSALTGLPFFGIFFALALIALGIRMIVRRSPRGAWHWDEAQSSSDERSIDEVAVFSALNKSFTAQSFKGGKIVVVFGGGEIDLTQAKAESEEVHLDVSSVFGGIEIIVPKEWKVKSTANVFLGSVDIHQAHGGEGATTLVLHGDAVFGGIEVRK